MGGSIASNGFRWLVHQKTSQLGYSFLKAPPPNPSCLNKPSPVSEGAFFLSLPVTPGGRDESAQRRDKKGKRLDPGLRQTKRYGVHHFILTRTGFRRQQLFFKVGGMLARQARKSRGNTVTRRPVTTHASSDGKWPITPTVDLFTPFRRCYLVFCDRQRLRLLCRIVGIQIGHILLRQHHNHTAIIGS